MNAIGTAIQEVEQRLQQLQELHASLVKAVPLLTNWEPMPEESAPTPATQVRMVKTLRKLKRGPYQKRVEVAAPAAPPKKPRALNVRKLGERPGVGTTATGPKVPAGQSAQAVLDGKATSVGGAMKAYIRAHAKFAGADLLAFLQKDEDYAKLLEQASASAVPGNLGYWVTQGYLDRAGGNQVVDSTYTVTAAGKEWFNK
jgi:hypothetical protein